jgi:CRISPR-associated endonuclease Cas3-HD
LGQDVLRLPTINVHIGVAKQWAKEVARAKAQVWRVEIDHNPSDVQIKVELEAVRDVDKDISISDRLVFPSSVLSYSGEYGLQVGTSGQDFQPQIGQPRQAPPSALQREGWIQHSLGVVSAIEQVLQNEQHAVCGLASLLGVSEDEIKKAAKLAALLHDLGKLNRDWQNKAGVSDSAAPHDLLAHTDGRDYVRFPPHATVGAYALWPALVDGEALPRLLAKAVCFAIAHHHSVRAKEVPEYKFHPAWQGAVQKGLRLCGLDGALDPGLIVARQASQTNLREQFPPMEYERLYTAYVLLSRWLRLADRIATGRPDALLHYENWFGRL